MDYSDLLATQESPGLPNEARVREVLETVLARPEYQPHEPNWFERLQAKVQEVVMDLLRSVLGSAADNPEVVRAILLGFLALVVVLLALWIARSWRPRGGQLQPAAEPGASIARTPDLEHALQAVRDAVSNGDFEAAMHALYRATWLCLAQRRLVRSEEDQTVGDLARALAGRAEYAPFRGLAREFEPVAFGGRSADRSRFDSMRDCADVLEVPR